MAADVLRLHAAPTRRQDIISAILNDYGDSRDDGDDDDVELDPYYTQAGPLGASAAAPAVAPALPVQSAPVSPVARDKPLPPLAGFQLRVADAPARSQPGSPEMQEQPVIVSRSLSRGRRPPGLRLAKSNGSTALTTATHAKPDGSSPSPSLAVSAPALQHHPPPDRARTHAAARLLNELPLPPTPPPPPAKELPSRPSSARDPAAGAATMGNKASKAVDEASSPSHPTRKPFSLRRKPVKKSSSPPVNAPNGAPNLPAQAPAQAPARADAAPRAQQQLAAGDAAIHKAKSDTSLQQSVGTDVSHPSPPQSDPNTLIEPGRHSQALSSTVSEATVVRDRSDSPPTEPEEEEPITPTLKPAANDLLPSSSPVPEESPSKYGVVKKPSAATMDEPPKEQKVAMHYRGKSSTGFDIFKSSTNKLQSTKAYQTSLSPPISPNLNPGSNPTSPLSSTPTPLVSPTPTTFELFNAQIRPERTSAPRLSCVHAQCFHNHRRFHRSNNRTFPVPCMLCFSSSPDFQWSCTWCALRICQGCRAKLESVPRKNLDIMLRESLGERTGATSPTIRNKENLLVKKTRSPIQETSKIVVWEA